MFTFTGNPFYTLSYPWPPYFPPHHGNQSHPFPLILDQIQFQILVQYSPTENSFLRLAQFFSDHSLCILLFVIYLICSKLFHISYVISSLFSFTLFLPIYILSFPGTVNIFFLLFHPRCFVKCYVYFLIHYVYNG